MGDLAVNVSISLIKVGVYIYDFITYPFYAIIQQPWKKQKQDHAKAISLPDSEGICFRSVLPITEFQVEIKRQKIETLADVLLFSTKRFGNKNAVGIRKILSEFNEVQKNGKVFKKYDMGEYTWLTYNEFSDSAKYFGRGLRAIGHLPKENLIIFSETRAEWLISAMGSFKQNIPVCTVFSTLGDDAVIHSINETEVRHMVVSHDLIPKIKILLKSCPKVESIIYLPDQLNPTDTSGCEGIDFYSFTEITDLGKSHEMPDNLPKPNDIAFIMYTSGSTGDPKGVIMSHFNLVNSLSGYAGILNPQPTDIYLAYLPLAHVLELIGETIMLLFGIPLGYSTPLTMTDRSTKVKRGCLGDVSVLKPTLIPCVPVILDRIYKGILEKVAAQGPFLNALFDFGLKYRLNWYSRGWETPFCNWFVFRKIRALLGGNVRLIATGGAPLSPDTHNFIRASLGVPVLQGYGLTETCGCATLMIPTDTSTGRAGGPLIVNDIKLVDWEEGNYRITDKPNPRGEVIIGGNNITRGYYKNPQKTDEDYYELDGQRWFRSGDIGELDPDGCLKIIDRKKDLVKLQHGEYVSLGKVESELKVCPYIENIWVYADPMKNSVVCIVTPDVRNLKILCTKLKKNEDASLEELCADKDIAKSYLEELIKTAKIVKLEKFEIPSAVHLTADHWTPESGLITAAYKLKRKQLQLNYQDVIDSLYSSSP